MLTEARAQAAEAAEQAARAALEQAPRPQSSPLVTEKLGPLSIGVVLIHGVLLMGAWFVFIEGNKNDAWNLFVLCCGMQMGRLLGRDQFLRRSRYLVKTPQVWVVAE